MGFLSGDDILNLIGYLVGFRFKKFMTTVADESGLEGANTSGLTSFLLSQLKRKKTNLVNGFTIVKKELLKKSIFIIYISFSNHIIFPCLPI